MVCQWWAACQLEWLLLSSFSGVNLMKNSARIATDIDGFIYHNIGIWRDNGYSDWHIGSVLMRPRLKTQEDFERWGLAWDPPDKSALAPPTPKHVSNRQESLARLHQALERAIAGDSYISRERLCQTARVGHGTFQTLCIEYPEVHRKWSTLKRLNRDRTTEEGRDFVTRRRQQQSASQSA